MMTYWQRILEREKYMTGFLSTVTVFQVRNLFADLIESEDTEEPVQELTKILLKDFNDRYYLAEGSKV